MPGKPETDDWRIKHSEQVQLPSSIYPHHQPWWFENGSKPSSADQLNGSIMNDVTHSEPLVSPSLSLTDNSGVCIFMPLQTFSCL